MLALTAIGCSQRFGSQPEQPVTQATGDFIVEVYPAIITAGGTAILSWAVKNVSVVTIEEAPKSAEKLRTLGTFGPTGSLKITPTEDTTYVISCPGSNAYSCVSRAVRVRLR
jgi:hypothetical protein